MSDKLRGRSALVTGSTSNIGRSIAHALAAEGAHVLVSGRDVARGAAVVDDIRAAGGRADLVVADLDGTAARSHALAQEALALVDGRLDVLVNNAGIYPPTTTLTADDEVAQRLLGVNVLAPYFLTQALAPSMLDVGHGVIVNLGSWVARLGVASNALYAATKGAMETLTRAWAAELGPRGVRVNAVSPGVIRAPELEWAADHPAERLMAGTPAGSSGHPDAIAAAVVFLASDESAFVHGTVLDVDGGRTGVAVVAGG